MTAIVGVVISFIMMAKNEELYLDAALGAIVNQSKCDNWELIFVDDHSTDSTYELAKSYQEMDPRIKVFRNPYIGKVLGTGYGFRLSEGDVIKCIDADDIVLDVFFDVLAFHDSHDLVFHSAFVVDSSLNKIASYIPNSSWLRCDYDGVATSLISLPKWSWSFSRALAHKIFPIPEGAPFEDVWMSLLLKKHARCPKLVDVPAYLYRQHENQTFGGILNFSGIAVKFRAKRLLALIDYLSCDPRVKEGNAELDFSLLREECTLLSEDVSLYAVLDSKLGAGRKLRLIIVSWFPNWMRILTIYKWKWEGLCARFTSRQ